MSAMLERGEQLAALVRLAEQAKLGRGSFVAVAGESGVGKSTLTSAFVELLADDFLVLVGACDALNTPRPLGPLIDVVAANPDLADLVGDGAQIAEPAAIYHHVLDWLATRSRPVLFLVEDVHWADAATNDLLRFLGRRVRPRSLLVVVTHRSDELGREHPLRAVLADIPRVERVFVDPLSVNAIQQLIDGSGAAGSARDAETVHQMTGGNAFFVNELLAGGERTFGNIYDTVLARLARIPTRSRRLVDVVAVSPNAVGIETALTLADVTVVDSQLAIDQGMLVADRSRLRFRHELAREAVYTSMAVAERVQHHRRFLDWELDQAAPDPARITHHAIAVDDTEAVLAWAPQAAALAESRRSHREAIRFHSSVIDASSGRQQIAGLCARSEQSRLLGHADAAQEDADKAVGQARLLGDQDLLGQCLMQLSVAYTSNNLTSAADPNLVEAMEALARADNSERLATAAFMYSFNAMLARSRNDCFDRLGNAKRLAAACGNDELSFQCRLLDAYIRLATGDEDEGHSRLRDLENEIAPNKDTLPLGFLANVGSGLGEVRRYQDATRYLDRAITIGQRFDEDFGVGYASAWQARIGFETGDFEQAAALASTVLARTGLAYTNTTAAGALGRTRVRRGDPHGCELLVESLAATDGGWLQQRWPLVAGVAEYYWLIGDNEAARGVLEQPYREALAADSPWGSGELALWWWLTRNDQTGDGDGESGDGDSGDGELSQPDRLAEPYALHLSGQWREAASAWAAIGCPYEQALALAFGDETMMREGLEILHQLQAYPAATWLRARLRAAGVTSVPRGPQVATRSTRFGLTARQMDVVELIAEGLGNGEIAERLFISKRTVEHHVSAIMVKLEARSRVEIAAKVLSAE